MPILALVPPVSVLLAKSGLIQKYDLSCVKAVVNGAAPLPAEVSEDLKRQLGGNVQMKQGKLFIITHITITTMRRHQGLSS